MSFIFLPTSRLSPCSNRSQPRSPLPPCLHSFPFPHSLLPCVPCPPPIQSQLGWLFFSSARRGASTGEFSTVRPAAGHKSGVLCVDPPCRLMDGPYGQRGAVDAVRPRHHRPRRRPRPQVTPATSTYLGSILEAVSHGVQTNDNGLPCRLCACTNAEVLFASHHQSS